MKPKRVYCSILFADENHHVFLQERDNIRGIRNPGKLAFFGGDIKPGESPEEAAVREAAEELEGYTLSGFSYFGCFSHDAPDITFDTHVFVKKEKRRLLEGLRVLEGVRGVFVSKEDLDEFEFADNCKYVVQEYFKHHHI